MRTALLICVEIKSLRIFRAAIPAIDRRRGNKIINSALNSRLKVNDCNPNLKEISAAYKNLSRRRISPRLMSRSRPLIDVKDLLSAFLQELRDNTRHWMT